MDQSSQPSCVFVPQTAARPLPLVVCLHGMGADETTWFAATPICDLAEKHGLIAACPFGRGNLFYHGLGGQDVYDLIQSLIDSGLADPQRVFLIGHSMGGFGTWWLGLGAPDLFAGIFPWSGFHPPGELAAAIHLGPGLVHSDDDAVVSSDWTATADAELSQAQIDHDFHLCSGYGHASTMIGDYLDAALESMMTRTMNPKPVDIRFAARHPLRMAGWWLASLGTGFQLTGEILELEAQILRPWEHGLGPDDPARGYSLLRIHANPIQGVALHSSQLTAAAGGALAIEILGGHPDQGGRVLGPNQLPLVLAPPGGSAPAPLNQQVDFIESGDDYILVETDGTWLGRAPHRRAVTQLARDRVIELGPRPRRLQQLNSAQGIQRVLWLRQWIAEAAQWALEGHPAGIILPEASIHLPDHGPLDPIHLLESYIRPEAFLGVFRFASHDALDQWLKLPRPFPLLWIPAPGADQDLGPSQEFSSYAPNSPLRVAIPLALVSKDGGQKNPVLETLAGYDGVTPESDPGVEWHGPGIGWPIGLEGQIITPGILALSAVIEES